MDLLIQAAQSALLAYDASWRKEFIESSHGLIAKQRSDRMRREHISKQELDIEAVIRDCKVLA
jgi:hypothetical protein